MANPQYNTGFQQEGGSIIRTVICLQIAVKQHLISCLLVFISFLFLFLSINGYTKCVLATLIEKFR